VSLNGGDEALEKVLSRGRRPSALLAVSDIMALGAMRAARRNGLRVPEELAVIGFDDIPLATASHPTLSTVHQPIREKGRVATRLLLRELDDSGPREQIVLPTELVLRETTSTGKAPLRREKGGSYRGRRTLTRAAAG